MTPLVMGVVNVTPDSFSDGGLWADPEAAIAHAYDLLAQGADILDIGGESTRPGATRPLVEEEIGRVLPVISALAAEGARVSVDTMRAEVAAAAIGAGASIVNDVSGGLADPRIFDVVADSEATYIAMHWRAHADHMADFADYPAGAAVEVRDELAARVDAITAAGIGRERIVLDPGLGFAKTGDHNWQVLRELDLLDALGLPVLIGASRKSFLGAALADVAGSPRPVDRREHGHTALVATLAMRPTPPWGFRVHDVRATRDALTITTMLRRSGDDA